MKVSKGEDLIISTKDEITKEWIGKVLEFSSTAAPEIIGIKMAPLGAGNMCETLRVVIDYANASGSAPDSVICKLSSTTPETVEFAVALGMYSREAHALNALTKQTDVRTPKVYIAAVSENQRTVNLVMEDLSTRATLGDQVGGVSNEEAISGITELARFHRAFWKDQEILTADWIYDRASKAKVFADLTVTGAQQLLERFSGRIPEEQLQAVQEWLPHTVEWTEKHSHGPTLTHGEPRADNMLFEPMEGGPQTWLIDFQLVDSGPPMFDIAYFVVQSLPPERRREMEKDLIKIHNDIIKSIDPSYTYELALEEYAASLSMAFLYGICATCVIEPGEVGDRLVMSWIDRAYTAISDWGVEPHQAAARFRE